MKYSDFAKVCGEPDQAFLAAAWCWFERAKSHCWFHNEACVSRFFLLAGRFSFWFSLYSVVLSECVEVIVWLVVCYVCFPRYSQAHASLPYLLPIIDAKTGVSGHWQQKKCLTSNPRLHPSLSAFSHTRLKSCCKCRRKFIQQYSAMQDA